MPGSLREGVLGRAFEFFGIAQVDAVVEMEDGDGATPQSLRAGEEIHDGSPGEGSQCSLFLLPFCGCSFQMFLHPELHNLADQAERNGFV